MGLWVGGPAAWVDRFARRGPRPPVSAFSLGTGEGAPRKRRRREEAGPDDRVSVSIRARSQQPWQHLLGGVGEGLFGVVEIFLPGVRVPDLDTRVRPDDHAVL